MQIESEFAGDPLWRELMEDGLGHWSTPGSGSHFLRCARYFPAFGPAPPRHVLGPACFLQAMLHEKNGLVGVL